MNTYEDDEFNRLEMESRVRMEAVKQAVADKPFNPEWNNFHDGVAVGRTAAFEEIGCKIKAMPFNDATIDSLLIWLKEQE